jgi:hypothetical protein
MAEYTSLVESVTDALVGTYAGVSAYSLMGRTPYDLTCRSVLGESRSSSP